MCQYLNVAVACPDSTILAVQAIYAEAVVLRARVAVLDAHARCTLFAAQPAARSEAASADECKAVIQQAQRPHIRCHPLRTGPGHLAAWTYMRILQLSVVCSGACTTHEGCVEEPATLQACRSLLD